MTVSCEPAQLDRSLCDMRVFTWAAHYAPVEVFSALQVLTAQAFAIIADRAERSDFATHRFAHNWRVVEAPLPNGNPNKHRPTNWVKWRIPEDRLLPTLGERNRPSVMLDGGKVRPTFEGWLTQRA